MAVDELEEDEEAALAFDEVALAGRVARVYGHEVPTVVAL